MYDPQVRVTTAVRRPPVEHQCIPTTKFPTAMRTNTLFNRCNTTSKLCALLAAQ